MPENANALREARPARLFFGVFSGASELLDTARTLIVERFGPLHERGTSPVYTFPSTRTYDRTMGTNLRRQFFLLDELKPQTCLAAVKAETVRLEAEIAARGSFDVERPINIDPGLLNDCRVILASTKDYAHRIYRGDGIWEEITLIYRHGAFDPVPWTYPDFRATTYHEYFLAARRDLLDELDDHPRA